MTSASTPIAVSHPQFPGSLAADVTLVAECGGPDRLAQDLVAALGGLAEIVLPMRLVFHQGRGEDYRLHVAYLHRAGDVIGIRRFRSGDPVAAAVRVGRSGTAVGRREASHV